MSDVFDVVIVGGGIMGCVTAWELAQRGHTVAVVEKTALASGATGRSSAIVRQHYSNAITARMARHGLDVFREFGDRVGGECGFENVGFLVLVPEGHAEGLRANVALQQSVGVRTSILSPEEIADVLPGAGATDLAAAAFEPDAGYADPHMTTSSYAEAAKRQGARFFVNREVTGIQFVSGKVAGVETNQGSLAAHAVVNCAGPWGARVAAMAGLAVPVSPCRDRVSVFRRPPLSRREHPVVLDFAQGSWFRPETGGLMIAGLLETAVEGDLVDPDDYSEHVDDAYVLEVGTRWIQRCPTVETAEPRRGYTGVMAITPDWHPIIDEVPEGSGHFLCTGFSGHGFKLAPAVGLMTTDLVLGEQTTAFDTKVFRLSRYAENDLVRGRYEYSITG